MYNSRFFFQRRKYYKASEIFDGKNFESLTSKSRCIMRCCYLFCEDRSPLAARSITGYARGCRASRNTVNRNVNFPKMLSDRNNCARARDGGSIIIKKYLNRKF